MTNGLPPAEVYCDFMAGKLSVPHLVPGDDTVCVEFEAITATLELVQLDTAVISDMTLLLPSTAPPVTLMVAPVGHEVNGASLHVRFGLPLTVEQVESNLASLTPENTTAPLLGPLPPPPPD